MGGPQAVFVETVTLPCSGKMHALLGSLVQGGDFILRLQGGQVEQRMLGGNRGDDFICLHLFRVIDGDDEITFVG